MQYKVSVKQKSLILVTVGLVTIIPLAYYSLSNLSLKEKQEMLALSMNDISARELSNLPARIKIPEIGVNSRIEYVALDSNGSMGNPKNPGDTAWFELGPRPGDSGSSVITGHSGWKNGLPAVFDDLEKLQKGDRVYVEDKDGDVVTFIVRDSRKFDPIADSTEVFTSTDDLSHLNLITCAGKWDKIKKSYSDRFVVFTDREI